MKGTLTMVYTCKLVNAYLRMVWSLPLCRGVTAGFCHRSSRTFTTSSLLDTAFSPYDSKRTNEQYIVCIHICLCFKISK